MYRMFTLGALLSTLLAIFSCTSTAADVTKPEIISCKGIAEKNYVSQSPDGLKVNIHISETAITIKTPYLILETSTTKGYKIEDAATFKALDENLELNFSVLFPHPVSQIRKPACGKVFRTEQHELYLLRTINPRIDFILFEYSENDPPSFYRLEAQ